MRIPIELYDTLTELKKDKPFNDIIKELIELHFKYMAKSTSNEYELYIDEYIIKDNKKYAIDISKLFRITTKNNEYYVEYYDIEDKKFKRNIIAWDYEPILPTGIKESFIKFIVKKESLILLQDLEDTFSYDQLNIKKLR